MWRSIDTPLKIIRSFPIRAIIRHHHNQNPNYYFTPKKTLTISSTPIVSLSSGPHIPVPRALLVVRCLSSIQNPNRVPTVDFNESVSCSEIGDGANDAVEEDTIPSSIPVRAYFFSTRLSIFLFLFILFNFLFFGVLI